MRRLTLNAACLLVAVATAAGVAAENVKADYHEGDCSWRQQGEVLKFPDGEYHCACGRLTLPSGHYRVFCRWQKVIPSTRKQKLVNRYGIAKGVIA